MKHCLYLFLYGSETMLFREEEGFRFRTVQMNNLRGLLGIRRVDSIPNAWIRELCIVKKGLESRWKD